MNYQEFLKLVADQSPDFYHQCVQWGIVSSCFGIAIGLILIIPAYLGVKAILKADNYDAKLVSWAVGLGSAMIILLIVGISAYFLLECLFFPKAYFISQFTGNHN